MIRKRNLLPRGQTAESGSEIGGDWHGRKVGQREGVGKGISSRILELDNALVSDGRLRPFAAPVCCPGFL